MECTSVYLQFSRVSVLNVSDMFLVPHKSIQQLVHYQASAYVTCIRAVAYLKHAGHLH